MGDGSSTTTCKHGTSVSEVCQKCIYEAQGGKEGKR